MSDRLTIEDTTRPVSKQHRFKVADYRSPSENYDDVIWAWFDDFSVAEQCWAVLQKLNYVLCNKFQVSSEPVVTSDEEIPATWKTLSYQQTKLGYVSPDAEFLRPLIKAFNAEADNPTLRLSCNCSTDYREKTKLCVYCRPYLRRLMNGLYSKKSFVCDSNYLIPSNNNSVITVKPEIPPAYTVSFQDWEVEKVIRTLGVKASGFEVVQSTPSTFEDVILDRLYRLEGMLRSTVRPCQLLNVNLTRAGGRWMCFHSMDLLCYGQTPEDACEGFDKLFKEGR